MYTCIFKIYVCIIQPNGRGLRHPLRPMLAGEHAINPRLIALASPSD